MSTFWRPIAESRRVDNASHKQIGHQLYEMWCRCDLCGWSGPSPNFALAAKGGFTAEFCSSCMIDGRKLAELQAEGWICQ